MTDRPLQPIGAIEVHGMTRSAFILRGALGAGAIYGAGAAGPLVSRAFAQEGGDVEILNFALMLQYLEEDFYRQGLALGLAGDVKTLATGAGATPVKKPTFEFPIEDQGSFVTLGMTLEDTGVMAFNGAGPKLISTRRWMALA